MGRPTHDPFLAVLGVSDVAIPATSTGAAVAFDFPYDTTVTGLWVAPQSGLLADAEALSIAIAANDGDSVISDGQAGSRFVPFAMLSGRSWKWCNLRREVRKDSPWLIQVANASAAQLTPWVFLRIEGVRVR